VRGQRRAGVRARRRWPGGAPMLLFVGVSVGLTMLSSRYGHLLFASMIRIYAVVAFFRRCYPDTLR